jgi:hypothetical protein
MPLCGVCYSKREAADNTHVKTCEPDKFAGLRMQDVETAEATTLGVPERTEQITPIPGGHYVGEIVRHKRYGFTGIVVTEDDYLEAGGKKRTSLSSGFLYVAVNAMVARREIRQNGKAYPLVDDHWSWQHV